MGTECQIGLRTTSDYCQSKHEISVQSLCVSVCMTMCVCECVYENVVFGRRRWCSVEGGGVWQREVVLGRRRWCLVEGGGVW